MMDITRLPNLLIVGISQYLFFYCLLIPLYNISGVHPSLSSTEFFLLVLATLLVTLGGYLINDIWDVETDKINKPEKVWVGNLCSTSKAMSIYFLVNLSGIAISIYTAISVGNWKLCLLYPLAAGFLYLYSVYLKQRALVGNLLVSLFCGLVFILVLFAEREAWSLAKSQSLEKANLVYQTFLGFAAFGFLITIIRELVKDLEDIEGDSRAGLRTLPIVFGVQASKTLIRFFFWTTVILSIGFIYWNINVAEWSPWGGIYGVLFLLLPLLFFLQFFEKFGTKETYRKMSLLLKLLMVFGLLYLPMYRVFIA